MAFDPNNLSKEPHYRYIGHEVRQLLARTVVKATMQWKYHEILQPAFWFTSRRPAAELYTVRVGASRLVSIGLYP